ncbi:hypothetical protein CY34DRAFT_81011, partial [Suillus luteus UH-Slu-Lm8-n1]
WDGTNTHCHRADNRYLINPQGLPICYKWQCPGSCQIPNHEAPHECSGCGSKEHGAQSCPHGEKI